MGNSKEKNRAFYLFAVLTLLTMAGIFLFSAQNAVDSKEISNGVLATILDLLGAVLPTGMQTWLSLWIRKVAHFVIYMILCFFASGMFTNEKQIGKNRKMAFLLGWGLAIVYACTDEVHQHFVPGRACMLKDVLLDSCGALCGAGIWFLNRIIFSKNEKK